MSSVSTYRLSNKEVLQILKEALAAMEVKNVNFFKIRAYQNAVGILDGLTSSIYDIWENKRLGEIPGIGIGLTSHLDELFTTGKVGEFEALKDGLPDGMFALIGLRSIGAKKAFKLAKAFNLTKRETAIAELKTFAEAQQVRELEGFGVKSEADLLEAINSAKMTKNEKQRTLYAKAEAIVERITAYMKECPSVLRIEATGSFRRRQDTIGDLDFPVATTEPEKVKEHFLAFPEIQEVIGQGDKKAMVVLGNDMQVDLRLSTPEAYGAMLQYNTGSKQHNIILRTHSLEKGMSLSEYGIKYKDKLHEFATEEEFYNFVGLPYIEPELRLGLDEVELAIKGKLPKLVQLSDIKGDLHLHTTDSDGQNTLEEVVQMAEQHGYEYIGISDHAPSVQSRGDAEVGHIIETKRKTIEKINARLLASGSTLKRVFYGYEVNILVDATLAMPDEFLSKLDYVIASVHTSFNQSRDQMTERFIAALENPYTTFIGHPSGRLLNSRDPVDPDWDKVFRTAQEHNKLMEINSQPDRLDLTDDLVRTALQYGLKLIVNTDSHELGQMNHLKYGVNVARRGRCTAHDVVNTYPLDRFRAVVESTRSIQSR